MLRLRRLFPCALVLAATLLAGCAGDGEDQVEPRSVALALDFQPNAVHAGIYTAAQSADERHGVDLRIRVPSSSTDSLKLLAAGRADAAIVDIHDLGLAWERDADLVGIGAIVQRPLAAVIAQPEVRRPRDLEGRRVGVTGLPSDDAVLRAVVEADGGDYEQVRRTTIGFSAVPSLAADRVDGVVTFWNAEGVALRQRGVETREFRVDEYGAPSYPELVLATTRERLAADGDLLRNLLAALEQGTREALADPEAAARLIADASDSKMELVRAQLDALEEAFDPPLELRPAALGAWARFDVRFGILERTPVIDELFRTDLTH